MSDPDDELKSVFDAGIWANGPRPVLVTRFTCPRCAWVTHHPVDVAEGYCGNCHDWTGKRIQG